jgi:hypothetical protein
LRRAKIDRVDQVNLHGHRPFRDFDFRLRSHCNTTVCSLQLIAWSLIEPQGVCAIRATISLGEYVYQTLAVHREITPCLERERKEDAVRKDRRLRWSAPHAKAHQLRTEPNLFRNGEQTFGQPQTECRVLQTILLQLSQVVCG